MKICVRCGVVRPPRRSKYCRLCGLEVIRLAECARAKRWYARNTERAKAKQKAYREANREKLRAYYRTYHYTVRKLKKAA